MTESPREAVECLRRALGTKSEPDVVAALEALTVLAETENRRLAGLRARRIPPEQRQAELARVAARRLAYQGIHGPRATLRGATNYIANVENLPRSRVRSYLEAMKK